MRYYLLLVSLYIIGCSRPSSVITTPGKYSAPGGKLTLEITLPDPAHIGRKVEWHHERKGSMAISGFGSTKLALPVTPAQWAFCFVGEDELRFLDGQSYSRYKGGGPRGDELLLTQMCEDASLGDRAPEALKQWKATQPNQHLRATGQGKSGGE
jgi:hypothetical protein